MPRDVVIVGGGPAGLAAAVWCRRLGLDTLLLEEAPTPGGQLREWTHPSLDYPGLPGLAGPELARRLAEHAATVGAELRTGVRVSALTPSDGGWQLQPYTHGAEEAAPPLAARFVILATGAAPRRLGVPGEAEMHARGEVWRGSRDASRLAGQPVVVVGSGDRAVQNALLLAEAGALVTLVHRPGAWRARASLVEAARRHPAVSFLGGRVTAIVGRQRVEAVHVVLPAGESVLPAAAVLVYAGYAPRADLLQGRVPLARDGTVPVGEDGATALPGIFAAGDVCTASPFRSVSTAVGQAMRAAKAVALALDPPPGF